MNRLHSVLPTYENFSLRTNTSVLSVERLGEDLEITSRLTDDDDAPTSVTRVSAVVVASGGYGASRSLVDANIEAATGVSGHLFPTTNGLQATGDAFSFLTPLDPAVRDLDCIQVHPTGMWKKSAPSSNQKVFIAPEALRAYGGILLQPSTGNRFVNELTTRDKVTDGVLRKCGGTDTTPAGVALMILNRHVVDSFGRKYFGFYQSQGLVYEYSNLTELVESEFNGTDVTIQHVRKTLEDYNSSVSSGIGNLTGKTVFPTSFFQKFFVGTYCVRAYCRSQFCQVCDKR